jgi:ribonuclease E
MKRMLINATQSDALRVAVVHGSQLIDLDIERPDFQQKKSNIYKGRISSIERSLGAVFVDYGEERHGFLPLKEISREYFLTDVDPNEENIDIHAVLKVGQELVIQVEKEERGNKGAALTTFISLAGSYLVLMPNNPRAGGISRRVEIDDREHLKEAFNQLQIPEGMGLIIRTAGVGRSKEELEWDLNVLLRYWEAVKQAAIARPGPYLIHQESDVIIRAIRDYLRQDMQEVVIDESTAYERALHYVNQIRPDFAERLQLYTGFLPLFSRFHIEEQIESAYQREVQLPSGGSLVIDHSEALVAIDINSSRATKGSNIEETAFNTNIEAAKAIARQLGIRDIGGLIVIDFIDMLQSSHQREVENCLRNALSQDRARIQIGRISRFGLLEMSRQRLGSSLRRSSRITCPHCDGQGSIRTVESLAHSIINLIQEQTAKTEQVQLQVILPVDIATYLINEKRAQIHQIEQQTQADIMIIPNPQLQSPHYQIKKVKEKNRTAVSYEVIKQQPVKGGNQVVRKKTALTKAAEPAIKEFLPSGTAVPPPSRKKSGGIIKRLWEVVLGAEKDSPDHTPAAAPASFPEDKEPVVSATTPSSTPQQQPPRHRRHRGHGRGDRDQQRERAPRSRQGGSFSGNTEPGAQRSSFPRPPRSEQRRSPHRPAPSSISEQSIAPPPAVEPKTETPPQAQAPAPNTPDYYTKFTHLETTLEQVTTKTDTSHEEPSKRETDH